jgi:cytochrome o ubiquinol oxidase subunit 2
MAKNKQNKLKKFLIGLIIFAVIADFVLLINYFMQGRNVALLNPQGYVAEQQLYLFIFTTVLLLIIAVPSIGAIYYMAWKYRKSETNTLYKPEKKHGKGFVFTIWAVPTFFMFVLAGVMVPATHRLVPQKVVANGAEPITIQVVSMNWKWLFIYPEQGIATVNYVKLPIDRPVTFEMTADESPMSSFWIPNLGGQLYSMATHVNRLNLLPNTIGDFPGSSAEINGRGFAGMKFTASVTSEDDFEKWVRDVSNHPDKLTSDAYDQLLEPSEYNPVAYYSEFEDNLFAKVIQKYYDNPQTEPEDHE